MNSLFDFLGNGINAYSQVRTSENTSDQAQSNLAAAQFNAQAEAKKQETIKNVLIYGAISLVALIITLVVVKSFKK